MTETSLAGRTALITGASRGIGAGIARAMAAAGARPILAARDLAACEALAAELGNDARALACDVADARQVEALFAAIAEDGGLDILVNNAGLIGPIGAAGDQPLDEWRRNIEVNLIGAFDCARHALSLFAGRGGVILNVSSGAALRPLEGWSAYCAGKAGLAMLTRSLHLEYADQGLSVYGLSPGTVATDMQVQIRRSGINPVSQMAPEDHGPVEVPARLSVWLAASRPEDLNGAEVDVRNPAIRQRLGVD